MADQERIPAATETVYLPRASWGPIFFALGAAMIVVGIYGEGFMVRGWVYMIVGTVFALAALRAMVGQSVRDFYARPRQQRESTAVLPAGSIKPPQRG
jgi:hypothetical protein